MTQVSPRLSNANMRSVVARVLVTICTLLLPAVVIAADGSREAVVPPTATSKAASGAATIQIQALVREKGTKKPLPDTNVYLFPNADLEGHPIKGTTDHEGRVTFKAPAGTFKWVISVPNYKRFERKDFQAPTSEVSKRDLYMEKTSYLVYETTVYGQKEKRDEKTKTLDQAQFLTVPGANGDPVKAVQNLPGVNRASAFSSQVIIEGSAPSATRYDIDNQTVPLIFHFGGLSSVVIPEAIDHVDYLSAGFGPEFGQSTAGFVNLIVKDPATDRLHGFAYADFLNAGGLIEGPINNHSSFLFGLRQSYIGFVLGAVGSSGTKGIALTAVPDFRDTVFEYRNQLNAQDTFKMVAIGSTDRLGFAIKQPADQDPSIRGNLDDETEFFRVIPEWTHKFDAAATARASFGIGRDWNLFDIGDFYTKSTSTVLSSRIELEDQINPSWKSYWGVNSLLNWTRLDFQLPAIVGTGGVINNIGSATVRSVANNYSSDATSLYWRNVIHQEDSKWTYLPGLRLSHFNLSNELIPEPRVAAQYALSGGWLLRAATGLYDEAPPLQDLDSTYGNKNLKSQRAIHGTVGFEKDFRDGGATGWSVTDDFFYKYLYNIVASTTNFAAPSQPEYYDNSGYGHIYGMEILAKYKTSRWEGWISYTLSQSKIGSAQQTEGLSPYDQTHLFTAVGEINFARNWKFSGRIRYVTGDPYTPIAGAVFDADSDTYSPVRGAIYSDRVGAFFQADARFDKKWIYETYILTGYVDIENVTNRQNPEQINYSYNYQQKAVVSGLPLLPTIGIKGEF